jgi:hypothetical protein
VIAQKIQRLSTNLVRSLTWDQGSEMGQHAKFTVDTGVAVYFCDPHSPWQRGTVENTNRLLRQYFPRGADYSPLSEADLDSSPTNSTKDLAKPSAIGHQQKSSTNSSLQPPLDPKDRKQPLHPRL